MTIASLNRCLNDWASSNRAVIIIASPERPISSSVTGPILMARRSWNWAVLRQLALCCLRASGSTSRKLLMTFAAGTSGGTTASIPSPLLSSRASGIWRSAALVIPRRARLISLRSASFRLGEPKPTTSLDRMVHVWPSSKGSGAGSRLPTALLLAGSVFPAVFAV